MRSLVTQFLRSARQLTGNLAGALGLLLIVGLLVAGAATWLFEELGDTIQSGATLAFDDHILTWMGMHQSPLTTNIALEITSLGTGTVVIMLACVSALFLVLNRQRYAGALLLVATFGGLALDIMLKSHYNRARPHLFTWKTVAVSTSFPSGHAMNAVVVYGTIAYLASRQLKHHGGRVALMVLAGIVAIAIAASRVYLGVHYPSDVLGGAIIGTAWAAFCMAALDGVQRLRNRKTAAELP